MRNDIGHNKDVWENGKQRGELTKYVPVETIKSWSKGRIAFVVLSSLFALGAGIGIGYGLYAAEAFGTVYSDTEETTLNTIIELKPNTLLLKNDKGEVKDVSENYIVKPTSSFNNGDLFEVEAGALSKTKVNGKYVLGSTTDTNAYLSSAGFNTPNALYKGDANGVPSTTPVTNDYLVKTDFNTANALYKGDANGVPSTTPVTDQYLVKADFNTANGLYEGDTAGVPTTTNVRNQYIKKTNLNNYFQFPVSSDIPSRNVNGNDGAATGTGTLNGQIVYAFNILNATSSRGTIRAVTFGDYYIYETPDVKGDNTVNIGNFDNRSVDSTKLFYFVSQANNDFIAFKIRVTIRPVGTSTDTTIETSIEDAMHIYLPGSGVSANTFSYMDISDKFANATVYDPAVGTTSGTDYKYTNTEFISFSFPVRFLTKV